MKLDIGEKGKTFHVEMDDESAKRLHGLKIGDEVDGSLLDAKFKGYKFQITGLSNNAGFPGLKNVEGFALKRLLLTKGKGMSGRRSKDPKRINGLRLKKTVRGNTVAKDVAQINMKLIVGPKPLLELLGKTEKADPGADAAETAEN